MAETDGARWRKFSKRFRAYLARKAQNIEDNGNPARAAEYRAYWGLRPTDEPKPLKPKAPTPQRPKPDPIDSVPKREPTSKGWNRP